MKAVYTSLNDEPALPVYICSAGPHSFKGIMKCMENRLVFFGEDSPWVKEQRITFDPSDYRWLLSS